MSAVVKAKVKYLENDREVAVYRASVAGGELVAHEGNYIEHEVAISDARQAAEKFSLDVQGFTLLPQHSAVSDFYDDAQLPGYEAEISALLKHATGASLVRIFDHTRRSSSSVVRASQQIREASSVIHNDYTANSGRVRLQDFLAANPTENADDLLQREFAIVNVWRSIAGTIENYPLAMCYADSVAAADLVDVKREGKERIGEIQLACYSNAHRWCYFPHMQRTEALVFKTYDSREDGRARFTIHTAFEDPTAAVDAPPRESIETRCFVFF